MSQPVFTDVTVDRQRPFARIIALLKDLKFDANGALPDGRVPEFPRAPQRIIRPASVRLAILEGPTDHASLRGLVAAWSCRLADLWETFELLQVQPDSFRKQDIIIPVPDDPVLLTPYDVRIPTFVGRTNRHRPSLRLMSASELPPAAHFVIALLTPT